MPRTWNDCLADEEVDALGTLQLKTRSAPVFRNATIILGSVGKLMNSGFADRCYDGMFRGNEFLMLRHRLTDEQWDLIADVFPEPKRTGRLPRDRRQVVDGILWIMRTGSPWRDLPEAFGSWATVWDLFDKWNADGTLQTILDRLRRQVKIDKELWRIDGTIVHAAKCAAGVGKKSDPEEPQDHAIGRSRGGLSCNIHLLRDGEGHPLHFHLTAGQTHESTVLDEVLIGADHHLFDASGHPMAWPVALAGDKGYRAEWIDNYLLELGISPVIPSKENEDREARKIAFDKEAYRNRNIVERWIGWLKECRRVFSRFEKTVKNFGGMIKMAFIQRYGYTHRKLSRLDRFPRIEF